MTFGKRFENGKGYRTLCQPTSVAIASTGDIFIADGYCNSRVLKYSARGELLRVFPHANGKSSSKQNSTKKHNRIPSCIRSFSTIYVPTDTSSVARFVIFLFRFPVHRLSGCLSFVLLRSNGLALFPHFSP